MGSLGRKVNRTNGHAFSARRAGKATMNLEAVLNDILASLQLVLSQMAPAEKRDLCRLLAGTPENRHKMLKLLLAQEAEKIEKNAPRLIVP